jgi:hypothetical protein
MTNIVALKAANAARWANVKLTRGRRARHVIALHLVGTAQHHAGKYVRDGVYVRHVIDEQFGCAGLPIAIDRSIKFEEPHNPRPTC